MAADSTSKVPERSTAKSPAETGGIKTAVITTVELLDKNKKRVFKQIFKELYFGLPDDEFPGDTITFEWQLGAP